MPLQKAETVECFRRFASRIPDSEGDLADMCEQLIQAFAEDKLTWRATSALLRGIMYGARHGDDNFFPRNLPDLLAQCARGHTGYPMAGKATAVQLLLAFPVQAAGAPRVIAEHRISHKIDELIVLLTEYRDRYTRQG